MSNDTRRPRVLVGGSILVAALSSACCWLPLAAIALGFSAAGFGSIFERHRVLLLALALGFLAGAVFLQRRAARACAQDGCPPAPCSSLALPVIGGALVLALALVPEVLAWSGASTETTDSPVSELEEEAVRSYLVDGMTCEGCTSLLVSYLEDQPEIRQATVDYAGTTARVVFDVTTTAVQAEQVMDRVSLDWEGKYEFEALPAEL